MNIAVRLRQANTAIDMWLTASEPNAAGRLGLFRILFAAFYLWHLSGRVIADLAELPASYHHRILVVWWAPLPALPLWFLSVVEAGLVTAIVLLLVGYRTQFATLAVLVLGLLYEGWYIGVNAERASIMLVAFVPFFMLLSGRWGDTYSLDSHLRHRAGFAAADPSVDAWPYFLPARAILVLLGALFLSAAVSKLVAGGTWLERPHLLADILLDQNIKAAKLDLPLNPLALFIAQTPALHVPFQYSIVLFEAVFILALFGRRIRDVILSSALIFHAINALWLVVTFTPLLIVYGLFVDWQKARERFLPRGPSMLQRLPTAVLVGGAVTAAVAAGLLWNTGTGLRGVAGLGGLLDWRTIWYVVLLFAALWWLRAAGNLWWPSRAPTSEYGPPPRVVRQTNANIS